MHILQYIGHVILSISWKIVQFNISSWWIFLNSTAERFTLEMKSSSQKRGRRKKDVEFEEIKDNLLVKKRQDRKDERQNVLTRELWVYF